MAEKPASELQESARRDPTAGFDRHWLVLALMLGLAAFAFVAFHRLVTAERVLAHYDTVQGMVKRNGATSLAAYVLLYIAMVCLSLPGSVMMTAMGGLMFGWLLGGVAAVVAAGTGAVGVFLIARSAVGPLLARSAGPRMARIAAGLQDDAASYLLFLRLTPLVPFFVVNVAAALFGVRLATFAWCTYVGIVPLAFALAGAGSALDGAVIAQKDVIDACRAAGGSGCSGLLSLRHLFTPGLLAALACLGLLALLPVFLKRLGLFRRWTRVPAAASPDGRGQSGRRPEA
jgi:uncharacterized membrane protein YdjX (TVP38/TMEM64 family)